LRRDMSCRGSLGQLATQHRDHRHQRAGSFSTTLRVHS
jgi:hypothetical protein